MAVTSADSHSTEMRIIANSKSTRKMMSLVEPNGIIRGLVRPFETDSPLTVDARIEARAQLNFV